MYTDLIHDDRPDLQDLVNNIGIEVTSSGDYKEFEADSTFERIYGKNKEELSPFEIDKMEELKSFNYLFEESEEGDIELPDFPAKWCTNEHILKEIEKKLKKLNKTGEQSYRNFDRYDLFIFSKDFLDRTGMCHIDIEKNEIVCIEWEDEIFKLIHEITAVQKNFTKKFTLIYIFWISKLYIFDINKELYCIM